LQVLHDLHDGAKRPDLHDLHDGAKRPNLHDGAKRPDLHDGAKRPDLHDGAKRPDLHDLHDAERSESYGDPPAGGEQDITSSCFCFAELLHPAESGVPCLPLPFFSFPGGTTSLNNKSRKINDMREFVF